ncbi:FAD binding domain-containing protein [Sphaerisporangium sp. TRM90804]|uniref:FAD binding domain-containing protein n=1 Tax=Sphaerisporangium sp. TRM90804 TaxID=3031113 RepID=UPI0024488CA9|nr:FAD binding domain-containing protein [Sphaerisporangium sp. TRM90804]MDH2424447.1 FAD binding domain-containing protein [Sphaerisporangium sp. TRM90804]
MKLPAFDYLAPSTVPEAVDALADPGRRAEVLAGGQSLLLDMRLGRAGPGLLVDVNGVGGLDQVRVRDGALEVGALARHRVFESPAAAPGPLGRLLALTVVHIAHPPIRARGTVVGSLAWAHPASEWCAVALALDAAIELRGAAGARTVAAGDYFHGAHATARVPGELITAVRLPLLGPATGVAFVEHRRTEFCFAQVAVAAALTVRDGVIAEARIGLANCADRPLRAHAAERSLAGAEAGPPVAGRRPPPEHPFARAGRIAAERDARPVPEPYADPEYRRHVIAVLVGRALCQASADLAAHTGHDRPGGDRP